MYPKLGRVFVSVRNEDKNLIVPIAHEVHDEGFQLTTTVGTHEFLRSHGIRSDKVAKHNEGSPHCVDLIRERKFVLVLNTTSNEREIENSYLIRRTALETRTPCLTTISAAYALMKALDANKRPLEVMPL